MKKLTINAFTNIKKMEEPSLREKISYNKLSDQLVRSNKNIKKEFILIAINRTLSHIYSQFGPSLRVALMKIIRSNLFINLIPHRYWLSFCCLDSMHKRKPTKKSKNAWFKYLPDKVSQSSWRDYQSSQHQLDSMCMKLVILNI